MLSGQAGPRSCDMADPSGHRSTSSIRAFLTSAMNSRMPTTTTTAPSLPPIRKTSRITSTSFGTASIRFPPSLPVLRRVEKTITHRPVSRSFRKFPALRDRDRGCTRLAWDELATARKDMREKGEETLKWLEETSNRHGIVLAGRPYHVDPGDQPRYSGAHQLLRRGRTDRGLHLPPAIELERPLIVMDQWMYHSRLYAAANYVKTTGESGSHPAELLRLRAGCRYHRPGKRYSDQLRQDLYLLEDRRGQQPGCRPYPCPLSVWPPSASGRRKRRSDKSVPASYRPSASSPRRCEKTIPSSAPRCHRSISSLIETAFNASGYRLEVLNQGRQSRPSTSA